MLAVTFGTLLLLHQGGQAETIDLGSGTIDLPPGFVHKPGQGIDSKVGSFVSAKEQMEIHYDIGRMAGLYADPKESKDRYVWFKEGDVGGARYYYALSARGVKGLYVTFPDAGPTNFYADVRTEREIERVLNIVIKFSPREQK